MTDNDLKKMNRKELLELLLEQGKENERLEQSLIEKEEELQNRELRVEKAGTMAEAALELNGIFEMADKAAADYLENIKRCSEEQQAAYDKIVSDAQKNAEAIHYEADKYSESLHEEADEYSEKTRGEADAYAASVRDEADKRIKELMEESEQKAKSIIGAAEMDKQLKMKEADDYWQNITTKLEAFYQDHIGLKELLNIDSRRNKSE